MNLSPERQAESDAMGIPWSFNEQLHCGPFSKHGIPIDGREEMVFATNASNAFHANQQTIEDLTAKVERLVNVLKNIADPNCAMPDDGRENARVYEDWAQKALKESEPNAQ